jgi:hypothetical protein
MVRHNASTDGFIDMSGKPIKRWMSQVQSTFKLTWLPWVVALWLWCLSLNPWIVGSSAIGVTTMFLIWHQNCKVPGNRLENGSNKVQDLSQLRRRKSLDRAPESLRYSFSSWWDYFCSTLLTQVFMWGSIMILMIAQLFMLHIICMKKKM